MAAKQQTKALRLRKRINSILNIHSAERFQSRRFRHNDSATMNPSLEFVFRLYPILLVETNNYQAPTEDCSPAIR